MTTENLTAWAITQGYNPYTDYREPVELPDGYLSEHFRAAEFSCNHCNELPADKYPPGKLLEFLETIRAEYGSPVIVNSGYRCPTHNENVDGAQNSYHLQGKAADFYIKDVSPAVVYKFCNDMVGEAGGVGKYETFTHIDVRGYRARW